MKFRIQTITKSIQILFSKEIQIFDPLLLEVYFFLAIRCVKELARQISPNSKVSRIFSEFIIKFYPQKVV
jgi:hypothetical protein